MKLGESYKQFLLRFDHAQRKLESLEVKFPSKVPRLHPLLKKLRLDTNGESMALTHHKGKSGDCRGRQGCQTGVSGGQGSRQKYQRGVHEAEVEVEDEQHDLQCALDVMAAEGQKRDGKDEEILKTFESYIEVRKMIQEQKKGREYFPTPTTEQRIGVNTFMEAEWIHQWEDRAVETEVKLLHV